MTTTKPAAIETGVTLPYRLVLNIRALEMTEDQFLKLCSDNGDLRMELTANRELIIMPPAGLEGGWQELEVATQVAMWAKQDGTGRAFGPNAGYTLPNGAVRAPDASWMPLSRWESLSRNDQTKFGHTFPRLRHRASLFVGRSQRCSGQDERVHGKRRSSRLAD